MNHQHFENWILSDEPLEAAQLGVLNEHLSECDSCHVLASAWRGNTGTMELYLKDLERDGEWTAVCTEGMTVGAFAGDKLLLTTTIGVEQSRARTPTYRVVTKKQCMGWR